MAKINKYWGMVALGAVTAAAAGAVAAAFAKRRALQEAADLEEDFEDCPEEEPVEKEKPSHEDFISWEAASDTEEKESEEENTPEETKEDTLEGDEAVSVNEALENAQKVAGEFEEDIEQAKKEQDEEEASIHID